MRKTDITGKNGQALMDTSSKRKPCQRLSFLVRKNYLIHTFCCPKHLRAGFLPFSGTWLRCLFPQPRQWDLTCSLDVPIFYFFLFPGHLRHLLNYVPTIQGDLGHLTCHVMLHNYIPDPGFQHLKSSKSRWGDFRLSFFVVPLWCFG